MPHYINGLDRNSREVLQMTSANISAHMDDAELRLIGRFIPPERRNGAIAFWTVPVLPETGQGHAVVVTIRRFPDAPEDTISGEHWKVISTVAKTGFFDPEDHRLVVGLPIADLLALRAGGLDCDGIFVPYEETIRQDDEGRPYFANRIDLELLSVIGVNDYLDNYEFQSPDEIAACQRIEWERTLWIDWNADPEDAPIIHPPVGGKYGYNAPI
ncbi:hypothetical protein [Agrobacterium radiobacter]|uniref:hypothetical protein n=1 Tax=Agrobacterium radiobacter TaxID=362 RepID=UPI003CE54DEF